ncbi:MAG: choice-of-anchor L domain-containing protein, partial [Pseudomonadota bacterium]
MATASELPINTSATALDMAEAMFGGGIQIQTASYTGATDASGIYSNANTIIPDMAPADTGVILSTGKATDFTNSSGDANTSAGTTTNHGLGGDADLNAIAGAQTFDAAIFEATFIPDGDVLTMQLTFSSEEYLEYVNSGFNDAVGVFVNGVKAELSVGSGDITINEINDQSNSSLYRDNPANEDNYNTEMDGLTVVLNLKAPVTADALNTIKIAIADGGDGAYDSNLLIAGDSIQTDLIAVDD